MAAVVTTEYLPKMTGHFNSAAWRCTWRCFCTVHYHTAHRLPNNSFLFKRNEAQQNSNKGAELYHWRDCRWSALFKAPFIRMCRRKWKDSFPSPAMEMCFPSFYSTASCVVGEQWPVTPEDNPQQNGPKQGQTQSFSQPMCAHVTKNLCWGQRKPTYGHVSLNRSALMKAAENS